jgi:L-threonylcarbamoyladenylate synthase
LVAFPTETVYGLGAIASSPTAIQAIYDAKQRPANNPLILHGPDLDTFIRFGMVTISTELRPLVDQLTTAFWPGPLTLIVPRGPKTPDTVTAGGPHVAIRVPDHPVALELLRLTGTPVAAPSANRSMRLSPTSAHHVSQSLDPGSLAYVVDGGPCAVGIESTVLDITAPDQLRILRPGIITPSEIAAQTGRTVRIPEGFDRQGNAASPGQFPDHYQPRIPLVLLGLDWYPHTTDSTQNWVLLEAAKTLDTPDPDHMLESRNRSLQLTLHPPKAPVRALLQLPDSAEEYARHLYSALHTAEESGVEGILVAPIPDGEAWIAVRDRLRRAATKNRAIIESVGGLLPWYF